MTETQPVEPGGNPAERIYEGTPALNAALAAVQRNLPIIGKGKTATVPTKTGGQYTYSYADLADVAAAVKPLLGEHGLAFTTWPTLIGNRFVLRYELLHESGEQKAGEYPLPSPMDVGAQALGSAITYARRYTLCAVTGVAPDDDDDAAAADAKRQAEQRAQQDEYAKEYTHAVESVMGAWSNQYGGWDKDAATAMFATWSKGGSVQQASPAQLRAFTGYLLSLPAEDAGSTPDPEQPPAAAEDQPREAKADRPMTPRQRGMLFALLTELKIEDAADQRETIGRIIERPIESRGELTTAEAKLVIDTLQAGVPVKAGVPDE